MITFLMYDHRQFTFMFSPSIIKKHASDRENYMALLSVFQSNTKLPTFIKVYALRAVQLSAFNERFLKYPHKSRKHHVK
jgi:hypothetical protein